MLIIELFTFDEGFGMLLTIENLLPFQMLLNYLMFSGVFVKDIGSWGTLLFESLSLGCWMRFAKRDTWDGFKSLTSTAMLNYISTSSGTNFSNLALEHLRSCDLATQPCLHECDLLIYAGFFLLCLRHQ